MKSDYSRDIFKQLQETMNRHCHPLRMKNRSGLQMNIITEIKPKRNTEHKKDIRGQHLPKQR